MREFREVNEGTLAVVRRWRDPNGQEQFRVRLSNREGFQNALFFDRPAALSMARGLAIALLAPDEPDDEPGETLDLGSELGAHLPNLKITEIQVA